MKLLDTKNLFFSTALVITSALIYSFSYAPDQDEWVVPAKYNSMVNPTDAGDADDLADGKSLYMKHCKSCHGQEGLGDGPKSAELDTPSGDFSGDDTQGQTDGALFYKAKEGRDDMPGFGKKIPDDDDIWLIINFIRTMKE